MVTPPHNRFRVPGMAAFALAWLTLTLVALGCGSDPSPTAPGGDTITLNDNPVSAENSVYLAFSPHAFSARKATSNDEDWLSTSKTAKPNKKTKLKLKDDDLKVVFKVPKHAVEEPVLITMATQPRPLSQLVVEMSPGGQEFDPSAVLTLKLDASLVDIELDELVALVASGEDGEVAYANIISIKAHGDGDDDGDGSATFDSVTIRIEVSHFSRYGLRNGNYWDGSWYEGCDFPPCPPPPGWGD